MGFLALDPPFSPLHPKASRTYDELSRAHKGQVSIPIFVLRKRVILPRERHYDQLLTEHGWLNADA